MARKGKKYEAEVQEATPAVEAQSVEPQPIEHETTPPTFQTPAEEPEQDEGEQEGEEETEVEEPVKVGPFHLEHEDGTQFKFTRFPMPKRAEKNPEGEFEVVVDKETVPVWTTASKGWAKDDAVIEYIWMDLGDAKGYITLDYGQSAKNYEGSSFTRGEGSGNRPDPKRIPKSEATEEKRKKQAADTLAKKQAAKKAAEEEQPEEQENDEQDTEQ